MPWVGTTPCGEEVRAFLGGMTPGAPCHAVKWSLTFIPERSGLRYNLRWILDATYGVPAPSNPNAMVDGPKVKLVGVEPRTDSPLRPSSTYRLTMKKPARTLTLRRVAGELLHFVTDSGALMVGTSGWSYTLVASGRAEQRGSPSTAPDMSYTISPKATGSSVFGIFEGRTPCSGIARELQISPVSGCLKVKWRVTLYQRPGTSGPATYKIEGTLHRQQPREGTWRILRGTSANPNAVIYQLAGTGAEGPLHLLAGDDNVLFFVTEQGQPLVGNADFSYTLNRVLGY